MQNALHKHWSSKTLFSITLPVTTLISVIYIANFTKILIYPTVYRVTYIEHFEWTLTGSVLADSILVLFCQLFVIGLFFRSNTTRALFWALSGVIIGISTLLPTTVIGYLVIILLGAIPALLILSAIRKMTSKLTFPLDVSTTAISAIIIVSLIEAASLVMWSIYPINPTTIFASENWAFSLFETRLYYLASLASPVIAVLISYWFLFSGNSRHLIIVIQRLKQNLGSFNDTRIVMPSSKSIQYILKSFGKEKTFLIFLITMSTFVPLYPFLPTVNQDEINLGVDIPIYAQWISRLKDSQGFEEIFFLAFSEISGGDRPLPLLSIYAIDSLCACSFVPYITAILSPVTAISTYYFVKKSFNNIKVARYAAILTVFTFHTLIGIYGGFLANWFALPILFWSYYYCIRFAKTEQTKFLYPLMFLSVALIFSHIYTWAFLVVSLAIFLAINSIIRYRTNRKMSKMVIFCIIAVLIVNFGVDYARTAYFNSVGGISSNFTVASDTIGVDQFNARWNNLAYTFRIYLGGLFADPMILVLAFIGMLILKPRTEFEQIVMASILILSFPLLFGNPLTQARIMYIVPFQIPAAIALISMSSKLQKLWPLFVVMIILYYSNHTLRSLDNLIFRPPV